MDKNLYPMLSDRELEVACAKLKIAEAMGLISSGDLSLVEKRRQEKNKEIMEKRKKGEIVYGVREFSPLMYLQYELTRFQLEFVVYQGDSIGNWQCHTISEKEKRAFFQENPDLFTRYFGDSFSYEDVEMIIEKRLKEREYENIVQSLLC